ncbi:MAG: DUF4339 domain-containing protein [Bacteroidales bacterium]|nr:DUF4339 domain-containing protein [Bacteroidales bacterium]
MTPQSFNDTEKLLRTHAYEEVAKETQDALRSAQMSLKMQTISAENYIPKPEEVKELFLLAINGEQKGPFTKMDIQRMLHEGTITTETLLWRSGLLEWTPVKDYSGLI